MSLDLAVRDCGDVRIVDVQGRITLGAGAIVLKDALAGTVAAGRRKILLNLAGLTYLDSAGLGVLISSFATVQKAGGCLKLLDLTNTVKDLLILTKLYTVFEHYENEAAALASFVEPAVQAAGAAGNLS